MNPSFGGMPKPPIYRPCEEDDRGVTCVEVIILFSISCTMWVIIATLFLKFVVFKS